MTILSKHSHGAMYSQVEGMGVNDTGSIIDYILLDELERIWKEAVMA
jgi:hypothetical protein